MSVQYVTNEFPTAKRRSQYDIGVSARVSNPKRDAAMAVLELLYETFPKVFIRDAARRQPLKVGIRKDLLAKLDGAVTPEELQSAVGYYVKGIGYLRSCEAGVARIDLDGNAAGSVSPEEAVHARARLQAIKARLKAQRSEPQPSAPTAPTHVVSAKRRAGLAELRTAGAARKAAAMT
jgi:ProP effector